MSAVGGLDRHWTLRHARRQRGLGPALTAAAFFLLAPLPAMAGNAIPTAQTGEQIVVTQGKSQLLHVGRPFAQVLIGAPEVADVLPMNGDTLYILGKKLGATNLTVYDRNHALIGVIDLLVGPDVGGLRTQLATLLPGEAIGVRASADSIVLEGKVSNSVVAERAVHVADSYAPGKVINFLGLASPQQVLLEVRFSEMTRSTAKALGIRSVSVDNGARAPNAGIGNISDDVATFVGNIHVGAVNINVALDALEQKGLINTLAQPNLIALSGETASFLAGGEFPIPVSSSAGVGGVPTISISFKEFGVSLAFTPTILADGMISLIVAPEVSSIDPNASIRLTGITIPGLRTRRARTTLEMRDGESFAIAGLIGADFANTVRQIPVLGSLPIIGALFRSTNFNRNETELVITVTPHIVRPVAPDALQLPTDRVRAPSEAAQFLLGTRESKHEVKP